MLEKAVAKLEQKLKDEPKNNPVKKAIRLLRKDLFPSKHKDELQQKLLGDRSDVQNTNSSSATPCTSGRRTHATSSPI